MNPLDWSRAATYAGIVALGERPEQFRLAISIHAPNDGLRRELMPINTKYPLADVIEAAKVFAPLAESLSHLAIHRQFIQTGRR